VTSPDARASIGSDSAGPAPQPPSSVGDDLGLGFQLPGTGTIDERGRRRVHPITPLVHGATVVPLGLFLVVVLSLGSGAVFGLGGVAVFVLCLIVLPVVVAGWSYLAWRNLWYWFDDDGDFRVDSGVITKRERRVQLSRLQSVDVAQPLVARVFSMAELSVEVAGAEGSTLKLQFLTLADARALRATILARAAGLRHDTAEAPEAAIATVSPRDLAVALLLRSSTAFLLLFSVLVLAISFLSGGWGGLFVALFTGGIPILIVVSEFIRYFNFTVSESPDGLRLRFGLAKTEARTVPPGRVQSIEYVEPLLWRRQGWVRVLVNIAGMGGQDRQGNKEETLLIPVASMEIAHLIVSKVFPDVDVEGLDWHPAPARSRRRSPIQWSRLAVAWDASVLAARRGRVTRRLAVIPHARTQSVRITQGPWERPLDLASVHVDTTPGPVKVSALHLDAAFAGKVAHEQAERALQARAADRTIRWAADPAAGEPPAGRPSAD
jgi:putative membrane protein